MIQAAMFLVTAIILLWFSTNCCQAFPPEWAKCIIQLCSEFDKHPHCLLLNSFPVSYDVQKPLSDLTPQVLLWSPQEQFHFTLHCPKCTQQNLQPFGWRDGSTARLIPRRIHGLDCTVLLVGRIYECAGGHKTLGYDPDILSQLPTMEIVPFRLWHKTGATEELITFIQSILTTGCSINCVTTMLIERRYSAYAKRCFGLRKVLALSSEFSLPTFEEWSSHSPTIGPSRRFISACFLLQFW